MNCRHCSACPDDVPPPPLGSDKICSRHHHPPIKESRCCGADTKKNGQLALYNAATATRHYTLRRRPDELRRAAP